MTTIKKSAPKITLNDGSIILKFKVSAKDIAKYYQVVVKEYVSTAEVKGFRKGKVPQKIVEKSLDKQKIYSHVLEHVLSPAYSKAIKSNKIIPIMQPHIAPISMEEGKDWEFKAETAIRPQIILGNYQQYLSKALKIASLAQKKLKKPDKNWQLTTVFDTLLTKVKINIAPLLIDEETKTQLSKLVKQLSSLKLSLEDYLKSIKKTEEALIVEYKESAETNLKLEFIVYEIVKNYAPTATTKEISDLKPEKGQEAYAKYLVQKHKTLDFLCAL